MDLTPEQILVALGLVLASWYLLASMYNRRRGLAAYRWLRDGLPVFGEKYQGKWLGSAASGAHLTMNKADPPFRQVEVIFLLESRELLPLWLVNLLRGKRDQVIVKGALRASHLAEVEIAPAGSRLARRIRSRADDSWTTHEADNLFIASRGRDADAVVKALQSLLALYGSQVRHISWSRQRPDLIAIFNLMSLLKSGDDATAFYSAIRDGVASIKRADIGV